MGGSCFEQRGERPTPQDRELPELDNFFPVQSGHGGGGGGDGRLFQLDGVWWPTAEHYFQAAKFPTSAYMQEQIRTAPRCTGPGSCFHLGRTGDGLRPDWEQVKVDVMLEANKAKFEQNDELRALLTGMRGRIRALGDADAWATWNEILLERLREELRPEGARDEETLRQRVAIMDAYRAAARLAIEEPSSVRAKRAVVAVAQAAARRQLPAPAGPLFTVSGFEDPEGRLDADWINGEFWTDPLEPVVNGQPHLMTGGEEDGEGGHLFLGSRRGETQWVLDESLDADQINGTLMLPASECAGLPVGTHLWQVYGGATLRLTIAEKAPPGRAELARQRSGEERRRQAAARARERVDVAESAQLDREMEGVMGRLAGMRGAGGGGSGGGGRAG